MASYLCLLQNIGVCSSKRFEINSWLLLWVVQFQL